MSDFDTTMTTPKFKEYKSRVEPGIDKDRQQYSKEYSRSRGKERPHQNNIISYKTKIRILGSKINDAAGRKRPYEQYNAGLWHARGRVRGWRAWRRRRMYDRAIRANDAQIANFNREIAQYNSEINNINNNINRSQRELNSIRGESRKTYNKLTQKNREKSTLIRQTRYYENRNRACSNTKRNIASYNRTIVWFRNQIVKLKRRYEDCTNRYNKNCSQEQQQKKRDEIANLIKTRENVINDLNAKQNDFKKICNNKIVPCNKEHDFLQSKSSVYNVENDRKQKIYQDYNLCMDPNRNVCKDKYKDLLDKQAMVSANINEEFTAFKENDSPYSTQSKVHSNYNTIKRDRGKLKHKLRDLDEFNKDQTSETSKYAGHKQRYDNAVYTNILLTALTTSLLYYVFTEL